MRYEFRPLQHWDRPVTPARASSGRFRAEWKSTQELLGKEVEQLGGRLVVLQIDATEADLRLDGMLRSNAKVRFPGVRISFESIYGSLTYATDAYDRVYNQDPPGWQANIRAIALALQALRAVDRYGVTSSGEQYRGWSAISAHSTETTMTREQAADLLAGDPAVPATAADLIKDRNLVSTVFRRLARRHHPDYGGDPELFRRLIAARDLLLGGSS